MKNKNSDTYGNCTIRDVERRPMVAADVKIEKINYLAKADSIDQVTDCPAQNQSEPCRKKGVRARGSPIEI